MTNIFISYSQADREKVETIAHVLEAEGWSVFWDPNLVGGTDYRKALEEWKTGKKPAAEKKHYRNGTGKNLKEFAEPYR